MPEGGEASARRRAMRWWPAYDWSQATAHLGAFHQVLVLRPHAVARLARHRHRGTRLIQEHRILTNLQPAGSRWAIPRALCAVRTTPDGWAGMLTSWVPGQHRDARWPDTAEEITTLLQALQAGEVFTPTGELPPPRAWCGGPEFPRLVQDRMLALLPSQDARIAAGDVVAAMLTAEQENKATPIHGDLGMHNIFWGDDTRGQHPRMTRISGLIDFDHATVGDPAIDVAPLIGQFGAEALAEIVAPATLQRALAHRATLSLQVAVAAELAGDTALRDFALANFTKRLAAGTLYDPHGARPNS
jgi:aminoglycoside phosphotransferase (APT) family kinase protein